MFIQPDTEIRLLKNCPLDSTYEHTIYFDSHSEQLSYFSKFSYVPFTKQTYQRHSVGVLTVQAKAEDVFDCNYLMFKNSAFENKWFYAFITKVEYVNNITSRIYYRIDVMQTWMLEAVIKPCFVEREHSNTDEIGENLVHEDIYFGPYTYENPVVPQGTALTMQDLSVVVMFNPSFITDMVDVALPGLQFNPNVYSGTFQGVTFLVCKCTPENVGDLDNLFRRVDFATFGGFLGAFMMPTILVPPRSTFNEYNVSIPFAVRRNNKFDGYEPKNKKLLTYPYTCANLTSNRNDGNDFAFERFTNGRNGSATFALTGNLCANPSSVAYATNYKNIEEYIQGSVSIPSYPICTWGADGITEWINNNLFKSVATAGLSAAFGASPAAAVANGFASGYLPSPSPNLSRPLLGSGRGDKVDFVSTLKDIPGAMMNAYGVVEGVASDALWTPAGMLSAVGMARAEFDSGTVHGDASGDVLIGTETGRTITARVKRITGEYAEIVDQYFSRFGYATMKIKEPNRTGRPYWNYVKTKGCAITGSVPAEDARVICAIYDRGITFWNKDAEIGNFEQDNSV